jgi:hypothetical protein
MAKAKDEAPAAPEQAPALTSEEVEACLLHLLTGQHNNVAGVLARPEKIQAMRERFARAKRNEAIRLVEAPLNRELERTRRGAG